MAKYRLYSTNLQTGNTIPLNATFKTKKAAQTRIKVMMTGRSNYSIGGRGFATLKEAQDFKKWRIKNPPLGQSPAEISAKMIIKPVPKIQKTKLTIKPIK